MKDLKVGEYENANKKKSSVISTLLTTILILMLFLPLFSHIDPPPEQAGILVPMDFLDNGGIIEEEEIIEEVKQEKVEQPEEVKEQKVEKEKKSNSESISKETIVTEDPEAIKIKKEKEKKKKEEAKKRKEEQEAEEARQAAEEAREAKIEEEKRKNAAEKKRKEEEAKKRADAKANADAIANKFGRNNKDDSQGVDDGAPGSDNLDGKNATGSGSVGDGLGGRGVDSAPKIVDNSQDTGVVVVDVCVDRNGNVIKAEIRQTKTTTTSKRLKDVAVRGAKRYRFTKDPSAPEKQCGTITVDFRLK